MVLGELDKGAGSMKNDTIVHRFRIEAQDLYNVKEHELDLYSRIHCEIGYTCRSVSLRDQIIRLRDGVWVRPEMSISLTLELDTARLRVALGGRLASNMRRLYIRLGGS